MPIVKAIEIGTGQTEHTVEILCGCGVWTRVCPRSMTGSLLESSAQKSDSLVPEVEKDNGGYPEYNWPNCQLECGSHLDLTLKTPRIR